MLIELNYPQPLPVALPAEKTLLLIIDMENENAHPDGALYIGEPVRKIIPKIGALRQKVRQAGGQVIHTQSVRSPDALEFTVFNNTVRKLEGQWHAEQGAFYRTQRRMFQGHVLVRASRVPHLAAASGGKR